MSDDMKEFLAEARGNIKKSFPELTTLPELDDESLSRLAMLFFRFIVQPNLPTRVAAFNALVFRGFISAMHEAIKQQRREDASNN